MNAERQRIDVWLFRTRIVKTRAAAARLVSEGAVRVARDGASRTVDKPSAEIAIGDALMTQRGPDLFVVRVRALPARRGPAAEARGAYEQLGSDREAS